MRIYSQTQILFIPQNSKISRSLYMTRILLDCSQKGLDFKTGTFILTKYLKCLQIIQNKIIFSYYLIKYRIMYLLKEGTVC